MGDWSDYLYFLALARARTLAGAARELGVDHTTVSRRVAALETAFGAKLFVRTPDGFVPTAAAEEALPFVEQAEKALEAAERRMGGIDDQLAGTIRLATSEALSGYFVRSLAALRARHPEILVEVLSGNPVLDLTRREADLAVRVATTPQGDLVARKIGEVALGLYAAEGYLARAGMPASERELAGHDIVGYDLTTLPNAGWTEDIAKDARIVMRGNTLVAVLNACVMGLGIAWVPFFLAANEPTLRRIGSERGGVRDVWLVVHPDLARVGRIRAVMDFLIETMAVDAALFSGAPPP